jgi:hypothetical protein
MDLSWEISKLENVTNYAAAFRVGKTRLKNKKKGCMGLKLCLARHHDLEHNDTKHNNIQHAATQHNYTNHNNNQHNDPQILDLYVALSINDIEHSQHST